MGKNLRKLLSCLLLPVLHSLSVALLRAWKAN